jgi:hypothetical protein
MEFPLIVHPCCQRAGAPAAAILPWHLLARQKLRHAVSLFVALNAHLGVLKKVFQVRAGNQASYQPASPAGPFFCPWNRFGPRLAVRNSGPAGTLQ